MAIAKYRPKVEVVEAVQYTAKNIDEVKAFLGPDDRGRNWHLDIGTNRIRVYGALGTGKADYGDWIVKEAKGYAVVKEPDFAGKYDAVAAAPAEKKTA